jgi:ribosomal protein S18 acetylase RimI-like enzyme
VEAAKISLRPANARDMEFLRRVHREAMRPHVERTWGSWDEGVQRKRFYESTDPATHEVIEVSGEPVGCQWVRQHPDALELVRLYLLPEAQGRGIGTHLVTALCQQAARQGLIVRLRVMRVNQAQRLYRRLGFKVVGETETHLLMERAV